MLEQQLLDYIKKAKEAGQSDEQTRALLYKNGWTETEVGAALSSLGQPQASAQAQPQIRPQPQVQQIQPQPQQQVREPQVSGRPEIKTQPQPAVSQPQPQQQVRPQSQAQQPQPQAQYQPQSPSANMQAEMPSSSQTLSKQNLGGQVKKPHFLMKLLIVLIILVVLGGAGYFVAGQYINLPWSPFKPSPETVVRKMLTNMKDIKSSQTKTQVEVGVTNSNGESQGNLSFSVNGASDLTDANNAKVSMTFAMNFALPGSVGNVASASADVISSGDTLYFKLSSISMPSDYSYPGVDFSQISGKWLKFDQDSIDALSEASGSDATIINVSQLSNSTVVQKIKDILSVENLFSNYQQIDEQTIDGQNTYHYLVTISKNKLNDLLNKIITSSIPVGSQDGSSSLAQNMVQAFAKTLTDAAGDINVEMWIGKKDYLLYQAKVNKIIDLNKIYQGADMQLVINFSEVNSDFNKFITIQKPQDAQKIEEIILPLVKTQKISSDISQIGVIAQIVFSADNNYSSLCSRGLLNGYLADYGDSLIALNNDIVTRGANKPACFAGVQGYCVSTQLPDESYVCIDELGALGKTRCVSSATVCK